MAEEKVTELYIADLHIHSRYSRATSKDCTPEYLDLWARRKGIHIVGTGDFTHPAWREELAGKLRPAEDGLYVLKEEYRPEGEQAPGESAPRFVITGEISSIYKKNGRVRKVHSLILLPGLEDAEKISCRLEQIGNIHSDGRPILGLDCRDLLEIVLELCPEAVYVPAHIWTPHFSLFGAFSGFDTAEECFEDLTPYIHTVETGLSSDPPMNWRVSALDQFQLISNSDAHSPAKLGREANLLDIPLSYGGLSQAIQTGKGLCGTIEFFPEEGKYHMDGHRKCNLCLTPSDTIRYGGVCPVCGRKITVGVSHRVEELADRAPGYMPKHAKRFESLVPLPEVIGACTGRQAAGKKVQREYMDLLQKLGPEFEILRNIPLEEIRQAAGTRIAEGIRRLRGGEVERIPGFDGEYGVIRLFSAEELSNTEGQLDFFAMLGAEKSESGRQQEAESVLLKGEKTLQTGAEETKAKPAALNEAQDRAVRSSAQRIAVKAGPGTGKTRTLVAHLKYLLENRRVSPLEITAVTFTNQAAEEMRERICRETGKKQAGKGLQIGTFHAVCLEFLKDQGEEVSLISASQAQRLAREVTAEAGLSMTEKRFLEAVSRRKSGVETDAGYDRDSDCGQLLEQALQKYEERKQSAGLWDFDDLLLGTAERIREGHVREGWEKRFRYLLVDEFQDISPVQYQLVKLWNRGGRELFVIGDPDQSIYGFRGADGACFERLQEEYDDLEMIHLTENYRSSPQILQAASDVISHNPGQRMQLHANCPDCAPVRLIKAKSAMAEAVFIAKEIGRQAGGMGMLEAHRTAWETGGKNSRGFGDMAVLYRTHRQARLLEQCLRQEGIPYVVAGREAFLEEPAVQGTISFLRCLEDEKNIQAMMECAEYIWKLEWNPMTKQIIRSTLERFRQPYGKKKPRKFLEQWMEEMGLSEDAAMQKLLKMAVFYKKVPEFLDAMILGTEGDLKRCGDEKYTSEAVTLMTLHGSKGLEYPLVFIYGADQGVIPLESGTGPADQEEERRLLYVGMTRAKEELIITSSGETSEFLEQIRDRIQTEETGRRREEKFHQMSLFE